MNSENTPFLKRILVGATCYADTIPALEFAVSLAKDTNARLEGLLLEDKSAYHLAALTCSNAVSLGSGKAQSITVPAMKQAFKRDAERFRKNLERAAKVAAIDYGFEQRLGNIDRILEIAHSQYDLVLLGFQRLSRAKPKLLVIHLDRFYESELHALAKSLSDKMGLQIEIISIDMKDRITNRQVETIMETLGTESFSAVMVPALVADLIGVDRLLDTARCPLIIQNSSANTNT